MNKTGLLIVSIVAAVGGLLFGIFPQLDVVISRYFFDAFGGRFPRPPSDEVEFARDAYSWLIAALAAPGFIAVAYKLALPRRRMLVPARAAILLIVTIAVGPGLLTNLVLKDHWGRARPYAVAEFKGTEKFTAWWDPRGVCRDNCSFIAGEPSGAFWTIAPAAVLAPVAWQPLAYAGAVAFGTAVGISRIALGAHFASDVLFAGVFMFLLIWTVHGLLYRWPRTRTTDAALEARIARLTLPLHDAIFPPKKKPARRKRTGSSSRKKKN